MATALVIGGNGQDGTFLCRRLLARGHSVISVGKQRQPRFQHHGAFTYRALDLSQGTHPLAELLHTHRPELVFHVAAVHASAGLAQYEAVFEPMLAVNVGSMHAVLEYQRLHAPEARAIYASSAKVFGAPLPSAIDEQTTRVSSCLYSVTKNAAGDAISHYRRAHGVKAGALYLFNHESELRPESFFVPKLVRALVAAARGEPLSERFATLDFHCDWGAAEEFMDIAIDCAERAPGEDFVLASGRCLHARALVEELAESYAGNRGALGDVAAAGGPGQGPYQVDTGKLQRLLGRRPERRIEALIRHWVDEKLRPSS